MAKDNENQSKHNGSNKGAPSGNIANQPGHTAEYHKANGNDQKPKK